jgi:DNA (cytosine-5)-methyltransferase 1
VSGLTAVSLFAGIGGFDLAASRAGIEVTAAVEIDKAARGVLADRFPRTVLFDDVREVTADDLRSTGFRPDRGILTGGFPCQDVSVAGRRAGLAGERTGLFSEIVRLADALRPKYLLLENVPGLLSSHGGRDMGTILGALGDLGYWYAYRVLDAQFFGVPQRRRRVFIVGHLGDGRGPVEILFEPEGGDRHPAPVRAPRAAVAGTLGSRAGGSRTTDLDGAGAYIVRPGVLADTGIVASLSASFGAGGPDAAHAQAGWSIPVTAEHTQNTQQTFLPTTVTGSVTHTLRAEGADASEDGTGRGTPIVTVTGAVTHSLTTSATGGSLTEDGTGRGTPIVTQESTAVRRLTPTECERLQGFPDGWTAISNGKAQADAPRYRQLGNAVAVPVAEWVLTRLAAVDAAADEVAA